MSRGHFGVALQVAERVKTSSVSFAQLQFDDGICSAWVYINVVSIVAADSIPYSGLHGEFFLFARG